MELIDTLSKQIEDIYVIDPHYDNDSLRMKNNDGITSTWAQQLLDNNHTPEFIKSEFVKSHSRAKSSNYYPVTYEYDSMLDSRVMKLIDEENINNYTSEEIKTLNKQKLKNKLVSMKNKRKQK